MTVAGHHEVHERGAEQALGAQSMQAYVSNTAVVHDSVCLRARSFFIGLNLQYVGSYFLSFAYILDDASVRCHQLLLSGRK